MISLRFIYKMVGVMNKLTSPVFTPKPWGSEVLWSLTDHYMAKTIEVNPLKIGDLVVYEYKEKSIIVIENALVLGLGSCCEEDDLEYTEYPEGWSTYIAPGQLHRYGATDKFVRFIEISSPQLDEAIVVSKIDDLNIGV